eukprot:gb/GECG01016672.1/.p1 GENE.gb/GECG01016672.1/~~gb/GECG01016672.1/.p1  ORF type:complete len:1008 (+),score=208.69 gb/GECG01016672.1/:1-3024(+)
MEQIERELEEQGAGSGRRESPRQTGESTLNAVEEDIRKAEELLARDVYRRGQEANRREQASAASSSSTKKDAKTHTHTSTSSGTASASSSHARPPQHHHAHSSQRHRTGAGASSVDTRKAHEEWREETEKAVKNALKAALGSPPQQSSSASAARPSTSPSTKQSSPRSHTPPSVHSGRHARATHSKGRSGVPKRRQEHKQGHTSPVDSTTTTSQQAPPSTAETTTEEKDTSFSREERDQIVQELLQAHASRRSAASSQTATSPAHVTESTSTSPSTYREATASWIAKQQERKQEEPSGKKSSRSIPETTPHIHGRHTCTPPATSSSSAPLDRQAHTMETDSLSHSQGGRVENFMDSDSEEENELYGRAKGHRISFVSQNSDGAQQHPHSSVAFRRKSKEELEAEAEEQFKNHHPFRPQINSKSKQVAVESVGSNCYERFDRYWQERQTKIEQLKRQRQQQERQVCTFKPKTNSAKKGAVPDYMSTDSLENNRQENQENRKPSGRDTSLKAGARLYEEAVRSRTKLEKKRQEKERESESETTYKPNVNPESIAIVDLAEWKPIHERITDMQREKNERVHQQRLKQYQDNPDLTYQPKILEKSEKMYKGKGDVTSRLLAAGKERESRLMQRKQSLEEENAKIYTYKPQVAKSSEQLLQSDPELKDANFLERQKKLEEDRTRKMNKYKEALRNVERNVNTYKPNTGNANEILSYTRPERVVESSHETYQRLANDDAQRKKIWHRVMEDEYYKQFKFKPELNETSRAVGRPHSFEELSSAEESKKKKAQLQKEAEELFATEYTFQPQFTSNPDRVLSGSKKERFRLKFSDDANAVMNRINEWKSQREAKLAEERREREFKDLESCTFVPQREYEDEEQPQQPTGPVVVRGLGRHLELQELAARKQDDYRRRYDEAFHENARYRDVSEATRPEPFQFQLEDEEREKRRQQRLEQLRNDVENSHISGSQDRSATIEKQRRINALLSTAETDFASPLPQKPVQARSPPAAPSLK